MYKIILTCPYFGRFRDDFSFWRITAEANKDIDFLIFTDDQNCIGGGNIKVEHTTFADFRSRFEKYFDFPIKLRTPYKLCDYKPSYGEVLSDFFQGYDFWGHCDVDLFFGNIRSFITDDILRKYDRILSRGHFTLYRNIPNVNSIYRIVDKPKYDRVYRCNRGFAFDEWPGTSNYWKKEMPDKLYDEIIFCGPAISRYDFIDAQWMKRGIDRAHIAYEHRDGKLYCHYIYNGKMESQEILYAHFEKRRLLPTIEPQDKFFVVPNKIQGIPEDLNMSTLQRLTPKRAFFMPYYEYRFKNLRRKVMNLFKKEEERL